MMKLQLINKDANIAIDCIIWNHNSKFNVGFNFSFDCLTFEEDYSACRISFNKFSSFIEMKAEKVAIKPNLINLSIGLDLYSTYESFLSKLKLLLNRSI